MPLGETWRNQRKLPQVFPKGRWAEGRASQLERQRENQAPGEATGTLLPQGRGCYWGTV